MNGVAISLYDKFEQLAVLVDVIRHNWSDDYVISVCSNHPDAEERMAAIDVNVDYFEKGAQITYVDPDVGQRGSNNLNYRIYDTLRTACRPVLANEDVEYVMHVHADAWQLAEEGFTELTTEMKQRNAAVGFPARMEDFLRENPPGYFYDQFIVFDAATAREADLFEHTTVEFLPESIHQTLAMVCIVNFGWSQLYHYANGSEREHWDGVPLTEVNNHARPMFHDPEYRQIHVATEDFEGDLGRSLQAHYLKQYGVDAGPDVRAYLEAYHRPKDELFAALEDYLQSLDRKLRWYGLSVKSFRREIRLVEQFLEEPHREKVMWATYLHTKNTVIAPLIEGGYETIQNLGRRFATDGDSAHTDDVAASVTVTDHYRRNLNEEDFPPELRSAYRSVFER